MILFSTYVSPLVTHVNTQCDDTILFLNMAYRSSSYYTHYNANTPQVTKRI